MTPQDIRDLLADTLPHENRDFLQSIREGGQDDGPYVQAGLIVLNHIRENYVLARPSQEVSDE